MKAPSLADSCCQCTVYRMFTSFVLVLSRGARTDGFHKPRSNPISTLARRAYSTFLPDIEDLENVLLH